MRTSRGTIYLCSMLCIVNDGYFRQKILFTSNVYTSNTHTHSHQKQPAITHFTLWDQRLCKPRELAMLLELEKLSRRDLLLVRWFWYYNIYAVIRAGRHTQHEPPTKVCLYVNVLCGLGGGCGWCSG